MTTKQYLNQLRSLERRISAKRRDLADLRAKAQGMISPSAEPVQQTGNGDRLCAIVARIVDMEHETEDDIARYIELRAQITAYIDMVPDARYVDILYRRYVHGQTWEQIADGTGYALRHIYRVHGQALREFARVMPGG